MFPVIFWLTSLYLAKVLRKYFYFQSDSEIGRCFSQNTFVFVMLVFLNRGNLLINELLIKINSCSRLELRTFYLRLSKFLRLNISETHVYCAILCWSETTFTESECSRRAPIRGTYSSHLKPSTAKDRNYVAM